MQTGQFNFPILGEWIFSGSVLAITLIVTTAIRALFKRLHDDHQLPIIRELAPTITNLLYVFGLKLFIEIAPLTPKVESWLDSGIYILGVVLILNLVRQTALLGLKWSTLRSNNSQTLQQGFIPLMRNMVTLFIFLSGGIMILKHFNYDVMSLLTALGVGSLAVGLGAKDTFSNMIAGFILIIDRNLRAGDRIGLNGTVGDVTEIGLRSTLIRLAANGNTLIVPNSDLVNTKIVNLSLPTRETTGSLQIRVPYTVPFIQVKKICLDVLNRVDLITQSKALSVNLISLAEGHQLIQIGFWISEVTDLNATLSTVNEKLLEALTREQIQLLPPSVTPR